MKESVAINIPFINENSKCKKVDPIDNNLQVCSDRVQKVLLLDISVDSKWLTYVTEHTLQTITVNDEDEDESDKNADISSKQYFLTVRNFYEAKENDTTCHISIDITSLVDFNIEKKGYFLSISPDGKRVAISASYVRREDRFTRYNNMCLIFRVSGDYSNIQLIKKLPFSGRLLFQNNTEALYVHENTVEVLDRNYRNLHSYLCQLPEREPLTYPSWSYPHTGEVSLDEIITKSRFSQHGIFMTRKAQQMETQFWDHSDKGARLAAIELHSRCHVVEISKDKTCIVVLTTNSELLEIYNTKRSLKIRELRIRSGVGASFDVTCVRFYNQDRYLVMTGVLDGFKMDSFATIDIWHIESGMLIYSKNFPIRSPPKDSKTIQPFVLESALENSNTIGQDKSAPRLKFMYTTGDSNGNTATMLQDVDIFQEKRILECSYKTWTHKICKRPLVDWYQLEDKKAFIPSDWKKGFGVYQTCFIRTYQNRVYLLRFDTVTTELWRLHLESNNITNKIGESDELLFIHHYKGQISANNFNFDENYLLKNKGHSTIPEVAFVTNDGSSIDRILVNTENDSTSYLDEIILPLDLFDSNMSTSFDGLRLNGACRALEFYSFWIVPHYLKYYQEEDMVLQKTKALILRLIRHMRDNNSTYFTTIEGSDLLTRLGSFNEGKEILYLILRTEQFSISIFQSKLKTDQDGNVFKTNLLTLLLEQKDDDLYKLLLNRLLLFARVEGVGGLSCITNALVWLQQKHYKELLVYSAQKLSYLRSRYEPDDSTIFRSLESTRTSFQNLKAYSYNEKLVDMNSLTYKLYSVRLSMKYHIFVTAYNYIRPTFQYIPEPFKKRFGRMMNYFKIQYKIFRPILDTSRVEHCVVPLVDFSSYYRHSEDRKDISNSLNTADENAFYHESTFIETTTNIDDHSIFNEGDIIFQTILKYKWQHFARQRFMLIFLVHLVFYISYSIGVSFSRNVFNYSLGSPITEPGQIVCLCLMFLSICGLVIQEIRQFKKAASKIHYFLSLYNWIDITAVVLPILMFVGMYKNHSYFDELNSFTALILWLHGILTMRVVGFVGITLETIIQLAFSIKEILLILFLVICAFTNAFIVLLSHQDDDYFQEQYSGTIMASVLGNDSSSDTEFADVSSSNPFTNVFKSFSTLWFFIYGVWDPVTDGDAGDNYAIIVLCILFSLVTVLIFFNLVIVYMSNKVEEIIKLGEKAWIRHFAAVITEIEQLWCFPWERYDKKKHPSYIYYFAHKDDVEGQEKMIQDETKEIIEKLDVFYKVDDNTVETEADTSTEDNTLPFEMNTSSSLSLHLNEFFDDTEESQSEQSSDSQILGQGDSTQSTDHLYNEIRDLKSELTDIKKVLNDLVSKLGSN